MEPVTEPETEPETEQETDSGDGNNGQPESSATAAKQGPTGTAKALIC